MTKKKLSPKLQLQQTLQHDVKKASELYGLTFDNSFDRLLGTGIKTNTLTYLYGKRVSGMLNILALNSVRQFGGRALFVDAGNAADPYLIRREADLRKKDSIETRKLLQSIQMMRVFTCHQLTSFVTEQLPSLLLKNGTDDNPFKFVGLCGFDCVFSEEESSKREISNLQFLIAQKLAEIAKDKNNGVMFIVATSENQCSHFLNYSNVAIEVYHNRRTGKDRAVLMRHYLRRGCELEL